MVRVAEIFRTWSRRLAWSIAALAVLTGAYRQGQAQTAVAGHVDTALVLAIDVSQSVDATRYQLQVEGIARALEDPSVISTVLSGPNGAIALALVEWADDTSVALDWQILRTTEDFKQIAAAIRALTHRGGEYTCLARMLSLLDQKVLETLPAQSHKVVVDVSGDGIDNCADATDVATARDALVAQGVTINGLPILIDAGNDVVGSGAYRAPGYGLRALERGPDKSTTTLAGWYGSNVIGGAGAFLVPSKGYEDFGRAFRQKFVTEISAIASP